MNTLKSKNQAKLTGLLVFLALAFWAALTGKWGLDVNTWGEGLTRFGQTSPFAVIVGLATYWLQDLLGQDLKARFVFWKFCGIPYPGSQAFSKWMHKDPRVDASVLKKRLKPLPKTPEDQNITWYKLSKKHEEKPSVLDAHGRFLLTRDVVAIWLIFGAITAIGVWFGKSDTAVKVTYNVIVVVGYLIATIVARNNGIRFLTTVLAEESARKSKNR